MMFNPPFFSFPFGRRYPMPYYNAPKMPSGPVDNFDKVDEIKLNSEFKQDKTIQEKHDFDDYNSQVFNIMGITLYFDDLLIIFLLFFLYSEGVKDDMLFIALLLLLLG